MTYDGPLIAASLKSRMMSVVTSILLIAFGICLSIMVIQFARHVADTASRDAGGIDLVITAKGSPMQAVLSSVYHIDIPIANIPQKVLEQMEKRQDVKTAIPLALGDSFRGFRIVGTTHDYVDLYDGAIKDGVLWDDPFEAVAGAATGLKIGDTFAGVHGFADDGHAHDENPYKITGVLKPTGTVIDRLILTSVQSVQDLHAEHDHDHAENKKDEHEHDHAQEHGAQEITAILIQTQSPLANMNMPRELARGGEIMATNPVAEMMRMTTMLGFGQKTLMLLAGVVMILSLLSIFAGITGAMDTRMRDMAILRALGYSSKRIAAMVVAEGVILGGLGGLLGLILGFGGFMIMVEVMVPLKASGATIIYDPLIPALLGAMMAGAALSALIPAMRMMRMDVAKAIAKAV